MQVSAAWSSISKEHTWEHCRGQQLGTAYAGSTQGNAAGKRILEQNLKEHARGHSREQELRVASPGNAHNGTLNEIHVILG